jgi:anti-sigma regulatory factor (Ser/Thr protein kinase)
LLVRELGGSLTPEQEQLAQLLISELVTNALRHTQSGVILIDVQIRDRIRVSVTDESPRMPRRQSPGPEDPKGRGLIIVEELADEWGIEPMPGNGKRIWFELPDADW